MKKALFTILACGMLFAACEKDEETTPVTPTPSFEFKNQNLQGKIGGVDWQFESGYSGIEQIYDFDLQDFVDGFGFNFYNVADTNLCDGVDPSTDYAFFVLNELKTGLIDFQDERSEQSATLYDKSDTISIGAFFGAIEILTVDTNNGVITGRMDIREFPTSSSDNYLNGNFSVSYCN